MKVLHKIDDDHALYQFSDGFSFGTDAVLLAAFVACRAHEIGVEFGAGCGVVSILLSLHKRFQKIYAIEIQKDYAALCRENVALCGAADKIEAIEGDLKEAKSLIGSPVDFVFANPPYMKKESGAKGESEKRILSRHEVLCEIGDVCRAASEILKDRGSLYVVYRPQRLPELFCAMRQNRLEPKNLILVAPRIDRAPAIVLVRGVKGARPGLKTEPVFLLQDAAGVPTHAAEKLYQTGILAYGGRP